MANHALLGGCRRCSKQGVPKGVDCLAGMMPSQPLAWWINLRSDRLEEEPVQHLGPCARPHLGGMGVRKVGGGYLVQNPDRFVSRRADWQVVTEAQPPGDQWDDIDMVWTVCAYAKSNAVILVKDGVTWDIGAGQQNRRDSGRLAGEKAAGRAAGGVYAGDAFFPFSDGLDGVISAGATTVIQPGGSTGDQKVIDRTDEAGPAMIFTGERHIRH